MNQNTLQVTLYIPKDQQSQLILQEIQQQVDSLQCDILWNDQELRVQTALQPQESLLEGFDAFCIKQNYGVAGLQDCYQTLGVLYELSGQFPCLYIQLSDSGCDLVLTECVDDDGQLRDFTAPEVKFDQSATEFALLYNEEVFLATIVDNKCVKVSKHIDLGRQVENLVCQFTRSNTLFLKDGSTLKYYPAVDQLSKAYIPRDVARVILEYPRIAVQIANAFLQICSMAGDVGSVPSKLERFDPSASVCSLIRLNKPSYAQLMSLNLPVPLQYASLQPFNAMILGDNRFSKNEILATQLGVRLTIAFDWLMSQNDEEYQQLQQSFSQLLKSSKVTFSDAEFDQQLERRGFWDDVDTSGQAIQSDTEWFDQLQIEEGNVETQIEDDVQGIINDFSETVKVLNANGQLEQVLTRIYAKIDKMQAGELSDDDSILGSDKFWDSEDNDIEGFCAQQQTSSSHDVNDSEQQNSEKEEDEFEKFVQSGGDDVLDSIGIKVHQILSQMTL